MNFGVPLLSSDDDYRYCYVRVSLLRKAQTDSRILDALLEVLDTPGKSLAALKKLGPEEKLRLIEKQIDHFRSMESSRWYRVDPPEVFAASIFRSSLTDKVANEFFFDVNKESALLQPVIQWLRSQGYDVYTEIPLGTKRVDVLGHKKSLLFGNKLIAAELKNEMRELGRALDQMTTFQQYAQLTYLACPPALAAEYLEKHADGRGVKSYDSTVFKKKLESFGFGLLLVEGSQVSETMKPKETAPQDGKIKEALAALSPKLAV
jgi:hypothetical protein